MMRESLIARSLVLALVLAVGAMGWACDGDNGNEDADADVPTDDVGTDDGVQPDIDVTDPLPDDGVVDDVVEDDVPPDTEPDTFCPAVCQTIPAGGEIGAPCTTAATCDHAADCLAESQEFFNGERYVDSYQGMCALYGPGNEGCDPDVPTTCPAGANCIYFFENMGTEYYGCVDACEPVDTSGNPYDYNCGCRIGYECIVTNHSPAQGVCFGGCSHDRECCERWWDENGDYNRQPTEVVVKEGCTNTCDNGGLFDDTTPPPEDCTVSFSCINNGDTSNVWSGPCEGEAWCPPDGRCLDPFNYRDETVTPPEPYYPGGVCIKDACNFAGRGCTEYGGACANLGYADDPFYTCVGTCHFGRELTDTDYECRTTAGQEQSCTPVDSDFWYSAPTDGSDGFCLNPYNAGGSKVLGETCADDSECTSPYGIGTCLEFSLAMTPFCGMNCSDSVAVNMALCGGDIDPDDPAVNTATGACWSGICWESCPDPTAALGANGCSSADNACYPTSLFGTYVKVGTGLDVPTGMCIPKCANDAWCSDFWGMPMTCDPTTGVCG
jgi:hypothetical protein